MSIVFFEGFNYSDGDILKLNPDLWTVNTPSNLSFVAGRTGNCVSLANRSVSADLTNNTILTLSNFTDPLIASSGFSLGFCLPAPSLHHRSASISSAPHLENFVKFYDTSNSEVLSIDLIKTSGAYGTSLGFGVYQNNSLVDVYDLKSHIGYSWSILDLSNLVTLLNNNNSYIDIYVDPKNNDQLSINFSASSTNNAQLRNTFDQYYTAISGFDSLGTIKLYSRSSYVVNGTTIDDLYIKSGNTREEAVIGNSAKIYKLIFDANTSENDWQSYDNNTLGQYSYLNSNDGDTTHTLSSNSGDVGIYNLGNLPNDSPSGVAAVKISNIVRSSDIDINWQMVNVLSSGNGSSIVDDDIVHIIDSMTYSYKETFLFENPITGSGWTKNDINNLQIGIKNLGQV
jgi:hypothetical protein